MSVGDVATRHQDTYMMLLPTKPWEGKVQRAVADPIAPHPMY